MVCFPFGHSTYLVEWAILCSNMILLIIIFFFFFIFSSIFSNNFYGFSLFALLSFSSSSFDVHLCPFFHFCFDISTFYLLPTISSLYALIFHAYSWKCLNSPWILSSSENLFFLSLASSSLSPCTSPYLLFCLSFTCSLPHFLPLPHHLTEITFYSLLYPHKLNNCG